MAGTSSVPQPIFGPQGFVPPDEADIYDGVFADINAAFGGKLNPAVETTQGQWASSLTALIGEENNQFLYYTNGVDPALNSGRMQDAIGRIYFLSRIPAESTAVQCTCVGEYLTLIPTGALASDTSGNLYSCVSGGMIPIGGSIVLQFANVATGPIACPATTLNTIYQQIPGWNTISNPADGVLGRIVESSQEFEARRAASVALNSVGVLSAIRANVLAVPGVLDCYATENDTAGPVTIGGVPIGPNSLYVSVSGGADLAVATAIWQKKPPGCAYTGSTVVTVYDSNSGYQLPYPAYTVRFDIQAATPILFAVTLASTPDVPANAAALVQAAIINAFGGGDGGPAAQAGSTIYASRFYPPLFALGPWVRIVSLTIGSQNDPQARFGGTIAALALTVTGVSGVIAAGQTLVGAGIPDGVTIVSGSGANWVVSTPLTVSGEPMFSISPTLNDLTMNINQAPTVSAANIAVTI